MSIYTTLWTLRFPRTGQYYLGCEWIEVCGQGVPGHIGTPTAGFGYETGDPFADFLPPAIDLEGEDDQRMRAIVIVTSETKKGTDRAGQEYVDPLLVLTGAAYARMTSRSRVGSGPIERPMGWLTKGASRQPSSPRRLSRSVSLGD